MKGAQRARSCLIQSNLRIDLLLTDVGLPGLNGRQLAEAARQNRPGLPIILIIGYGGSALREAPVPEGAELIQKPFPIVAFAERVTALLAAACPAAETAC